MNDLVVSEHNQVLVRLEEGRRALAEARTLHDAKQVRDVAKAVADYVRQQQLSYEAYIDALELKLWAERLVGQFLKETVRPGRPQKRGATRSILPQGVTRHQSKAWQRLTEVPEPKIKTYLQATREKRKEPSTAAVIRLGKKKPQPSTVESPTCTVDDLQKLLDRGLTFGTLYMDPPWQYDNQGTRAATDNHYVTMPVEEIAALPVSRLAAEQCHLHLWTTDSFLEEAIALLKGWGFQRRQTFVWVKPQIGIGNYWRSSHEYLLLGVKGGLTFPDNAGIPSWFQANRTKHSAKPHQVRRLIEQVSLPPRLELFGREPVDGWTVWGNQIERGLFDQSVQAL